jgi:opacity protein-like surface antigen
MTQSFKKISLVCFFIAIISHSTTSSGQDVSASMVPASGTYIGLGFGASSTQFNGQQVQATGISTVSPGGTTGSAGGPPVSINMSGTNSIAPAIQVGYFQKFQDSSYLWGAKFSYSYMGGSTSTTDRILIPQFGTYPSGASFTGNAVAMSYQKTIKNQISFIPYFGQSFDRGTIYFGVGPTVSQVNTKINNLIGFADLNGVRTDVSGTPQNFTDTQWVYGGSAMLGGTYFLDKSWFLDIGYSYSMTQNKTSNYYSTFNNPGSPNSYSGSLIGSSTGTASIQTLGLTLNKLF